MRHQLPVYSPVTWRAVATGAWAALRRDPGNRVFRSLIERLEARYDAGAVILTDSGTSALRLAIEAVVAESPGPVALPGYSCYDVATAAIGAGAKVVLYDLDPRTLGPDPESLAALSALRPAAVVVAHLYGYPADVRAVADALGDTIVVEDAAQGAGGELEGNRLGSFGSVSVLSFGRGKGMTGGGGGALLAHDERGEVLLQWVRDRGLRAGTGGLEQMVALAAQLVMGRPWLYGIPASLPFLRLGETLYHPPTPPREASRATVAALGALLGASDEEVSVRRRNAERLSRSLLHSPVLAPVDSLPRALPGFLRLPALPRGPSAPSVTDAVRRLGVMPGYPTTLAALPGLASVLARPPSSLTGADLLAESLVTLPTHRLLHESDLIGLEEWLSQP